MVFGTSLNRKYSLVRDIRKMVKLFSFLIHLKFPDGKMTFAITALMVEGDISKLVQFDHCKPVGVNPGYFLSR